MNIILKKREMNYVNKLRVSCEHNLEAMLVLVGANSLLLRTAEETSHVRVTYVEEKESAVNCIKSFSSEQQIKSVIG